MDLFPREVLNQLPLLSKVFYEADPLLYVKLFTPGEPWLFYIWAMDDDEARVAGFVDSNLTAFGQLQWCPRNDLAKLKRSWSWDPGESTVMRDATFIPCRHSQVKLIWGKH